MKRIVTLLLAAGLVLGAAAGSQAADIKAKGTWEFGFEFSDRTFQKHDGEDTFKAQQRLRTQIDVIASESLFSDSVARRPRCAPCGISHYPIYLKHKTP